MPASQTFLYGYTFTGTPGGTVMIDSQIGASNGEFILTDDRDGNDADDQTQIGDHMTLSRGTGGAWDYVLRGLTGDGGIIVQAGAGSGSMYLYSNTLYSGGESMSSDTSSPMTYCFGPGTAIDTPSGPVAVDLLQPGDVVTTTDGLSVPVLWVGRQTLRRALFGAGMVRLCAGALGGGLPVRDLLVTSDHALLIDGLMVQAGALVNGHSIVTVPRANLPETLTVYHVETPGHEAILAEGAACETFIDAAGRRGFDNYDEYLALTGADRIIPENSAPRISSQRLLPDALRARFGIEASDDAAKRA